MSENTNSLCCSIVSFASCLFITDLWVPKCQTISDYCWIRGSASIMRIRGWRIFIECVGHLIVRIIECCSCWNTVYVGCVLFLFLSCRQPFEVWCLLTCGTDNHRCRWVNPLNADLNPICYLLALLGAHHFLHVSRIRFKREKEDGDHGWVYRGCQMGSSFLKIF